MKWRIVSVMVLLVASIPAFGKVELSVSPQTALFDQPVSIVVTGLVPVTKATLTLATKDAAGNTWQSHATFFSNPKGTVDLQDTPPYSGTYEAIQGVYPMGLFWSMQPPSDKPHLRFMPTLGKPNVYHLNVSIHGKQVAAEDIVRRFVAPGVATKHIRSGDLYADLYYPENFATDGQRHSAVIVLGGSGGGIVAADIVGQWLASHGFVAMATAWYGIGPLPKNMVRVPITPVKSAIAYLQQLSFVNPNEIGAWGGSWGGILALFSASHFPQIHAVVDAIGGPVIGEGISRQGPPVGSYRAVDKSPFLFDGKPVPFVTFKTFEKFIKTRDSKYVAKALIPIARINGPILDIASGDDHLDFSGAMVNLSKAELRRRHHPYPDEVLYYPNAGHLIFPGYFPTANDSSMEEGIATGGTSAGYARANANVGPETIKFLREALSGHHRK